MNNFTDVAALHHVLSACYNAGEGAVGRNELMSALKEKLNFNDKQAHLYAWTVLFRNTNGSADWVNMNAYKVIGIWKRADNTGTVGNLVVSKTESWIFREDLTYEHKHERYEGYMMPLGGGYSRPSSSCELGLWAPPDKLDTEISIVVISQSGHARHMAINWLDSDKAIPIACTIDRERFARQ